MTLSSAPTVTISPPVSATTTTTTTSTERYEEHTRVSEAFVARASSKGMEANEPASVLNIGALGKVIDPSTRFIGSAFSVMKEKVLSGTLAEQGVYLLQRSMRTKSAIWPRKGSSSMMTDDAVTLQRGSIFSQFCTYTKPSDDALLHQLNLAYELLTIDADIAQDRIGIHYSSVDTDRVFVDAMHGSMFSSKEKTHRFKDAVDRKVRTKYYRHIFGINTHALHGKVEGRNINFAIRNYDCPVGQEQNSKYFRDVGNLIIVENEKGERLGTELALGVSAILKEKYGLISSLDAEGGPDIEYDHRTKLQDCIVVLFALFTAGLHPKFAKQTLENVTKGIRGKSEVMGEYIRGFVYHCSRANLDTDQVESMLSHYVEMVGTSNNEFVDWLMCQLHQQSASKKYSEGKHGLLGYSI